MIYERHLIKSLLSNLAVTLGAIVCLVWLSQIMKLAFMIELGIGAFKFWLLTISSLPTIAVTVLPLGIAIAYYGQYSFLSSDRELIALISSGLSNASIARPAIKLAIVITVICYALSFYLAPVSYHFLKNHLSHFRNNYVSQVVHERSFNKISKNLTVYVESKDAHNIMNQIIIFDNRDPKEPSIIFADKGILIAEENIPMFILKDGIRQYLDKNNDMNQMTFKAFKVELPQGPSERAMNAMDLQEYTIWQLFFPDESLSELRQKQIQIEKHTRIIWPGYILAFALMTIGLFLRHPYSRTASSKSLLHIVFALGLTLCLHFTFHNLALKNTPLISLCYINVICACVFGYILLARQNGISR